MTTKTLSPAALTRALHVRDLSDPQQGSHIMQQLIEAIHTTLAAQWRCRRWLHRTSPLVTLADQTPPIHPFYQWSINLTGFLGVLAGLDYCF